MNTTVTVGSGRSIHWGSDCGTLCGAAHRNGFFTEPKSIKADGATCKRCIKIMALEVAKAEVEAYLENESRTAGYVPQSGETVKSVSRTGRVVAVAVEGSWKVETRSMENTLAALVGRTVRVDGMGGKLTGQWTTDEAGRTLIMVRFPHPVGPRWYPADDVTPV